MNIVLVGMSGAGKSTIGYRISEKLDRRFYDIDQEIVLRENLKIEDIFSRYGEEYFRSVESNIIEEVSQKDGLVISTGGGSILDSRNIVNLRRNSQVIYLRASVDQLYENLQKSNQVRPLINKKEDIGRLLETRSKIYEASCDYIIDTDSRSISDIVASIIKNIK